MRNIVLFAVVLNCGCGDKQETARRDNTAAHRKLDIVTVMPVCRRVMDAPAQHGTATRPLRFQREVIDAYPGLYGPVAPRDPDFSVSDHLAQLETFLPTMRDPRRTCAQADASLAMMRERFGRLSDMSAYLAPSLFTSNGQVRVVDDRPVGDVRHRRAGVRGAATAAERAATIDWPSVRTAGKFAQ
jgi:hypothetical protein